ncbi:hypothetical protein LNK15_03320 [Jeotgalicoccus huakuii]|nr:hypothetical protein [Jeotgalicoccus huakuii]
MAPYISAVSDGIKDENWILSMIGSLTLIDICSSMSAKKNQTNGKKYADWFDEYCTQYKVNLSKNSNEPGNSNKPEDFRNWLNSEDRLVGGIDEVEHTYFNGILAYALRCSLLHNGNGNMSEQTIHKNNLNDTLGANNLILDASDESLIIEQIGDKIFLNPKHFCEEVVKGVNDWIKDNKNEISVINNSNSAIKIKQK